MTFAYMACTLVSSATFTLTYVPPSSSASALSLFVVYLHNVRHFSTDFSTLLLALAAIAGLVSSPFWGTMTDRFGPLRVILVGYGAEAAALVVWAFAHPKLQATGAGLMLAIF